MYKDISIKVLLIALFFLLLIPTYRTVYNYLAYSEPGSNLCVNTDFDEKLKKVSRSYAHFYSAKIFCEQGVRKSLIYNFEYSQQMMFFGLVVGGVVLLGWFLNILFTKSKEISKKVPLIIGMCGLIICLIVYFCAELMIYLLMVTT